MNKTVSGLILGVVLSVFSTIALANYCTDQDYEVGSTKYKVCLKGEQYRLTLSSKNYAICKNACAKETIVTPGSMMGICITACTWPA